jgi:hypothetical protein
MKADFFPLRPDIAPTIYAYADNNPQYAGLLKIGYTEKNVEERIAAQYPTKRPREKPYKIAFAETAMRADGTTFKDFAVHKYLRDKKFESINQRMLLYLPSLH